MCQEMRQRRARSIDAAYGTRCGSGLKVFQLKPRGEIQPDCTDVGAVGDSYDIEQIALAATEVTTPVREAQ